MITANFKAYASYVTDSLHQWDLNQVLQVSGLNLTTVPEVHFSNANTDRAIPRQATMNAAGVVAVGVPNSLLQDPLRIYAHIGIYEGDTFKVVELVEIPVIPRKRPADYQIQDGDEEIYSFKALENAIANMATRAQVANIVANANSTDGNSELVDIRVGADGVTYDSAGEAVRGQLSAIGEKLDQVSNDFLSFRTIDGEYVEHSDGSFTSYNGWSRTDYINLAHCTRVIITTPLKSFYNAFYDEGYNFVKYILTQEGTTEIEVPDGARYLILSNKTDALSETLIQNDTLADMGKLLRTTDYRVMFFGNTKFPNFDTVAKQLTIYGNTRIIDVKSGNYYDVTNDTVVAYTEGAYSANKLLYYPADNTFALLAYSLATPEGAELLGYISTAGIGCMVCPYTVNGRAANLGIVPVSSLDAEAQGRLAYVLPEVWRNKVEEINDAKGDRFTFCIQTDTHYRESMGKDMGRNVSALSKYVAMDFVANLGDIVQGYGDLDTATTKRDLSEIVRRYIDGAACPVLLTVGNHDVNVDYAMDVDSTAEQITQKDHFSRITLPTKNTLRASGFNGRSTYYFEDFEDAGIRVVVLNSTDGAFESAYDNRFNISAEQVEWFKTEALNTEHAVIVMTHTPLVTEIPDNPNIVSGAGSILTAAQDFKTAGGHFVAFLYGHTHSQGSATVNGVKHISFERSYDNGHTAEVVMVDTKNRTIETIGLGVAENRTFTY